jgi:glutathione peroxidase
MNILFVPSMAQTCHSTVGKDSDVLVNTASQWDLPQYAGLQAVWDEYRRSGLVVVGIPATSLAPRPGTNEESRNSAAAALVLRSLTEHSLLSGFSASTVRCNDEEYTSDILPEWNFHKYLFSRDGAPIEHFPSSMRPDDIKFTTTIERNLGTWTI